MGIKEDWNNFRDPIKQMGRNIKDTIKDAKEDYQNAQQAEYSDRPCEHFYMYYGVGFDRTHGISEESVAIPVKTEYGPGTLAFGQNGIRITESKNDTDAFYSYYTEISKLQISQSKSKGYYLYPIFFGAICCIGSPPIGIILLAAGALLFFHSLGSRDLSIVLWEENTQKELCQYRLIKVPTKTMVAIHDLFLEKIQLALEAAAQAPDDEETQQTIPLLKNLYNAIQEQRG